MGMLQRNAVLFASIYGTAYIFLLSFSVTVDAIAKSRIVILHIPLELFSISISSYFPLFAPVLWPFPSTCIGGDNIRQ